MNGKYPSTIERGFYGIGIYRPKKDTNIGTLIRSALNFGASFIFTIDGRYNKQKSDTVKAWRHIPLYEYKNINDLKAHIPRDTSLVYIEQTQNSHTINNFVHPERAIYILGAEDEGIPEEIINGDMALQIDTPMCLNVAVAGSIVMFHRKITT